MGNINRNISISQNMKSIELSQKSEDEYWSYSTCFDYIDIQKDIIEIKNKGENEVSAKKDLIIQFKNVFKFMMSVKIIDKGKPHDLKFGLNKDIDVISINEKNQSCTVDFEEAAFIRVKNGTVIFSECVQASIFLNTFVPTNLPTVVLSEGTFVTSIDLFHICKKCIFRRNNVIKNISIQTLGFHRDRDALFLTDEDRFFVEFVR